MSRTRRVLAAQLGAGLMMGAVLVASYAPQAQAADELTLTSTSSTSSTEASIVTDVTWVLPSGASAGDTVVLPLTEHTGGLLDSADWTASSGVVIGVVNLDGSGMLRITLNASSDAAANRSGHSIITTDAEPPAHTASEAFDAFATLEPGQTTDGFFGIADRTRANKYGQWAATDESIARWSIESPRGPWDSLRVSDLITGGQSVDCGGEITVRSTTQTDAETGYLVALTLVDAERVAVECAATALTVTVADVATDEIVEVSFRTVVEPGASPLSNSATIIGLRSLEVAGERLTSVRHLLAEVTDPPRPPGEATPTPVPTPVEPELPAQPVTPTASALAATGLTDPTPTLGLLAGVCIAVGIACTLMSRAVCTKGRA